MSETFLPPMRVGNGFDIHRTGDDPARKMVLGGVVFPGECGLVGHSDGDVVAHACAEAILGAAGLDDIGTLFPDTDPSLEGADSIELLRRCTDAVSAAGWSVANVDCSVVCERPKLAPARADMQRRLSDAVGAPVTVKGRRAEGVGPIGDGQAIACFASALVVRS